MAPTIRAPITGIAIIHGPGVAPARDVKAVSRWPYQTALVTRPIRANRIQAVPEAAVPVITASPANVSTRRSALKSPSTRRKGFSLQHSVRDPPSIQTSICPRPIIS
jgi:hypothetical protein